MAPGFITSASITQTSGQVGKYIEHNIETDKGYICNPRQSFWILDTVFTPNLTAV